MSRGSAWEEGSARGGTKFAFKLARRLRRGLRVRRGSARGGTKFAFKLAPALRRPVPGDRYRAHPVHFAASTSSADRWPGDP